MVDKQGELRTDSYVAKATRWQCITGMILGIVVVSVGLDLHWFHLIKAKVGPNHPAWVFLVVVGGWIFIHAVRSFVSPKSLFMADSKGITIFSGTTARVWNTMTKSFDITRRVGDAMLIPWVAVVEIGEGKIDQGYSTHGKRRLTSKALKVLCDSSCRISGYDSSRVCTTWDGYTEDDLRLMSKADRERAALTPDDMNSGFVVDAGLLPGGLDEAIRKLRTMHARFGQQGGGHVR